MSDEIGRMSEEDKFLGVRTTMQPPPDTSASAQVDEIDIEVVDDRPENDRRPVGEATSSDDDMATDEEISNYGGRAQKRIKKLKWEFHEERRAKEASDRLAGEAVNYTQNLQTENQRLLKLVQDSHSALNQHSQYGADAGLAIAEANFKQAHESGESEQIIQAQKALTNAQLAQSSAPAVSTRVTETWKQNVLSEQRQQAQQQAQQQVEPQDSPASGAAVQWQEENPWFGDDEEMTSLAYGVHEKLVRKEGVDPETQEYYELIDKRMREKFPEYFGVSSAGSSGSVVVEPATRRRASPVVAPAVRNNGAVPRKVTLTSTQVGLAKRLGITPQQYASQLIKEMV
tara:strand:- start:479 stop:1507 length:1029 start_codon:yes stop_codon:yes gene_type:complete